MSSDGQIFSTVPVPSIPRTKLPIRDVTTKMTLKAGYLTPVFRLEVNPGDTLNLNMNAFCRLASPLDKPIMDNMYIDFQFFFVPYRLVWDNWVKMHGEQKNPGDSIDYICPTVTTPTGGAPFESIYDYMDVAPGIANVTINSLPFRAYNLIYNEWYRDENLQNSVVVPTSDSDSFDNYTLLKRNKRPDYFTRSLPWPQKGDAVTLPLSGGPAPVVGNGQPLGLYANVIPALQYLKQDQSSSFATLTSAITDAPHTLPYQNLTYTSDSNKGYSFGVTPTKSDSGLIADLSTVSAVNINQLRIAYQTQKLLERDARGGTRYTELLQSHFGVRNPDLRLQRPEYLGGTSFRLTVNTVVQNSESSETPQGNLASFVVSNDHYKGFMKTFLEYGVVIGLGSIRADLTYQQGTHRDFFRSTRYDYYYPVFAHLGEQAVLNQEIYTQGTTADKDVFGYQERWAEYRYIPNKICGQFRSQYPQTLDVWHLSQEFSNLPVLNSEFIEENPPIQRVSAVSGDPIFLLDLAYNGFKISEMPLRSIPGWVDHF